MTEHSSQGWNRITERPQAETPSNVVAIVDAIDEELPVNVDVLEAGNVYQDLMKDQGLDEYGVHSGEKYLNEWHIAVGQHPRQTDQAAVAVSEVTVPTGYGDEGYREGELVGYEVRTLDMPGEVVAYFPRDTQPRDIGRTVAREYESVLAHQRGRDVEQQVALDQVAQQQVGNPAGPGVS